MPLAWSIAGGVGDLAITVIDLVHIPIVVIVLWWPSGPLYATV